MKALQIKKILKNITYNIPAISKCRVLYFH